MVEAVDEDAVTLAVVSRGDRGRFFVSLQACCNFSGLPPGLTPPVRITKMIDRKKQPLVK